PIRWLCAVYGGRTVEFELDGIKSSNKTYGHRFLSPRSIRIRSFQEYLKRLEKKHVIVDQNKRKELVKELAVEAAKKAGGRPVLDEDLVEMLTNLVEYPNMVCGGFAREYLELPKEVVVTPMRKHQRYLPVVDDQGNLLPSFVAISNMRAKDMEPIREGNEQVLKARLEDADFYYKRDLKLPLAERVPALRRIIFQERLGSLYDKVERLQELSAFLAERIDPSLVDLARRAAYLSKADLITSMVKEFTELQGVMGRIYALHFGERAEVAQAIEEHYLPRFAGDQLPASTLGAIVGIADRMDSLAGCFGVGLIPTGSEDPYALRRAALGILQILLEKPLPLRLPDIVGKALNLCWDRLTRPIEEVERELLGFLRVRLEGFLVERGIPSDLVEATLSVGFDDVFDAGKRAEALAQFRREPDFAELSVAFKRVINIIPEGFEKPVDPTRFLEGAERALHGAATNLRGEVDRFLSAGDYLGALRRIATIKPIVDMFFEEVLVNVEDETLRGNRYALLKETADLFTKIADFRKITVV
ncbi:MAG: glycine--tRNA ligase subunit beta, partial [Candidatus Methylomirabilales bacterium]